MVTAAGGIGKVIVMFGKILETKFINQETYALVQGILNNWQKNEAGAAEIQAIVGSADFNEKWRKRLEKCVGGAEFKESNAGIDGLEVDSDEEFEEDE